MKAFGIFALLLNGASAHYAFSRLIISGVESGDWEYVRDVANGDKQFNANPEYGKVVPQMGTPDLTSANITCGRNAFASAGRTKTATIQAGSQASFGIHIDGGNHYLAQGAEINHRGPAMIWLSRAPNDVLEAYSGNGDWFKIGYVGPKNDSHWETFQQQEVHFKIPKTTPPGKYLLRIEHFWILPWAHMSQWYVNCAHVEIVGQGGGVPEGFARFPGTYNLKTPGLMVTENQHMFPPAGPKDLLQYTPPLPVVWEG